MIMEKIQILAIGRDSLVLQKLSSFINQTEEWECTATTDDESAIELFHQRKYDIVLLIDDMEGVSVNKFNSVFSFNNPELIIIHHVGDSTEILADEIKEALEKRKKPVKIVDDVFKDKKDQ
jgi:DNA-binding NarL/FixJ family response regulator